MRRYSKKTIRHLQRCRDAQKRKKDKRAKEKVANTARVALRKRIENHTLCLKAAIIAIGLIAKAILNFSSGGKVVKLPIKQQAQAAPTRKAA